MTTHFISKQHAPSQIETACGEYISGTLNIDRWATADLSKATCPKCQAGKEGPRMTWVEYSDKRHDWVVREWDSGEVLFRSPDETTARAWADRGMP